MSLIELKDRRKYCCWGNIFAVSLHELEGQPASTFHCWVLHGPWSKLQKCKRGSSVSLLLSPKGFTDIGSEGVTLRERWSSSCFGECELPRHWTSALNDLSRCHLHNGGTKQSSCSLIPTDICILINVNFIFKVWLFICSANIRMAFEHYFLSNISDNHVTSLTWASLSVAATVTMSTAFLLVTWTASFMFFAGKDGILFSFVISINHSVVKMLRYVKSPAGSPCEHFITLAPA